ncbi:MAG TPA: hypothetical protein VIQ51_11615 [Chryseosolibacter sp.]|jgi:hypothetical protein
MYEVVEISRNESSPELNAFTEALRDSNLCFKASALEGMGVRSYEELSTAVGRAMTTCATCGLPLNNHFKRVYISDDVGHMVSEDWMLTKLAYTLVLLNCSPSHQTIGQFQIELIRNFIEKQ